MSRVREDKLDGFGSDSFLDIIANIVGILIILIVIAGLRVAQQPVVLSTSAAPTSDGASNPAGRSRIVDPIALDPSFTVALKLPDRLPVDETPELPRVIEPDDKLVSNTVQLEEELNQLTARASRLKAEYGAQAEEARELNEQLAVARKNLNAMTAQLRARIDDETELKQELQKKKAELKELQRQLVDVETQSENVQVIRHRLTPIGRVVEQKELHFRVHQGRVSYVPIEELLERLKVQVQRQKNWLTKFHRHEGFVGPIEGFSMTYVVERQTLSFVDQMRHGSGLMRIAVSEWVLDPEPDLVSESAATALRRDSRFFHRLQQADGPTVVTFWVYADSFEAYRQLRDFAHQQGFQVAGRPLPEGIRIAGGPRGSRSSAQ